MACCLERHGENMGDRENFIRQERLRQTGMRMLLFTFAKTF